MQTEDQIEADLEQQQIDPEQLLVNAIKNTLLKRIVEYTGLCPTDAEALRWAIALEQLAANLREQVRQRHQDSYSGLIPRAASTLERNSLERIPPTSA